MTRRGAAVTPSAYQAGFGRYATRITPRSGGRVGHGVPEIQAQLPALALAQGIRVALAVCGPQEPPEQLKVDRGRVQLEHLRPQVGQAEIDRHRQRVLALGCHGSKGTDPVGRTRTKSLHSYEMRASATPPAAQAATTGITPTRNRHTATKAAAASTASRRR